MLDIIITDFTAQGEKRETNYLFMPSGYKIFIYKFV